MWGNRGEHWWGDSSWFPVYMQSRQQLLDTQKYWNVFNRAKVKPVYLHCRDKSPQNGCQNHLCTDSGTDSTNVLK